MKSIVIAGSASLQEKVQYWKKYWTEQDYYVSDCPEAIAKENFLEAYPKVHSDFFKRITEADVLFLMNETKKGITGYIGAESFAELCFALAQNLVYHKNIELIVLQMPEKSVQCYEEINLWLQLGWIKLWKPAMASA